MENCHERRWPPGLSSLETRQNNRRWIISFFSLHIFSFTSLCILYIFTFEFSICFRLYENYVCKRVPGKQAVLVLRCDNKHIGENMMVEPGLVMIFAHGIEWFLIDMMMNFLWVSFHIDCTHFLGWSKSGEKPWSDIFFTE